MNLPIDGDNPEIQFDPLFPEFVSEYNLFRVANVVRLQDWSNDKSTLSEYEIELTTIRLPQFFRATIKIPQFPNFNPNFSGKWEYILPTTEGLVIFPY